MELLRGPGGCPWDAEQTHESIRKDFIEETYEVIEAINKNDKELLKEELGDVLLQVAFHTQIEKEENGFEFSDVCDGICKKLIERHPHVFGDINVSSTDEVLTNWDNIKRKSKGQKTQGSSMLKVPKELPALMRAQKVLKKAIKGGYDATSDMKNGAASLRALADAIEVGEIAYNGSLAADSLLAICAYAQAAGADSEELLTKRVNGFIESYK